MRLNSAGESKDSRPHSHRYPRHRQQPRQRPRMKMIHSSDQELVREQGCGAAAVEVPENGVANEGQNNLRVEVPQDVPRIQE